MANPLDGYAARRWSTYVVTPAEGQLMPFEPTDNEFLICSADSDMARALAEQESYNPAAMFFSDFEQLAAGHNVYGVGPLVRLADEYEGHPAGKLAFVSYEGMENDTPEYTIFIED